MSSNNDLVLIPMAQRNSDVHLGMTSSDLKGPVLSFHNISYEVKEKRGFLFGQKTIKRKKLSDINGIMKPGLNAIMGPSESGKSLLLDILAGRKDPSGLSGDVWVHEVPEDANFPHILGYVVHDDVVIGTLTVRENLQFSASLRLPTTVTKEEKNKRIDEVISELGLHEVADSKVDSKGLRKMTSIAMELIPDPLILFLDEPTTGLDWRTANHVVRLLKSISERGRTIIFSIHQPHYSIFKLFDSLTLLASGELLYHGPAQEAFNGDHYIIAAESFLGVINGIIKGETEDRKAYKTEEVLKRDESVIKELAKNYAESSYYYEIKNELNRLKNDQNKRSLVRKEIICVTPFGHQLIHITWRSFQNLAGDLWAWITQIIVTFIVGLAVGAVFLWLKNDCTEIPNRARMLFLLMTYQYISSVLAVKVFVVQKQLFKYERIDRYYTVASYFFGNILSALLSRRFLPSFIFTSTLYFMVGLEPTMEAFFIMVFTLMILAFASISMALAIGANHSSLNITTRVMVIYFLCMQIFTDFRLILVIPQLSWIQYFSIPYYGLTALQHNEFLGRNFCTALNTTLSLKCPNYVICSGEEFLEIQGIDLSPWGLWKNHVALAILMIFFLVIAYLRMLFLKKFF